MQLIEPLAIQWVSADVLDGRQQPTATGGAPTCKLKAVIGLYQCVAAIPSVYDVTAPQGLEDYTRWANLIQLREASRLI
jgi:hypothetical protein